ncbi:MAG: SCP2 sterol-binding domain-containing protein [Acidobacteria bacterium]|nr:SCP2 sterol-binding domain-containing protein [Acidobacteriota bacterium]
MTDTAAAVREIITNMPSRLDPDVAAGLDATIQLDLSGEGGGVWHCTIKDGACTAHDGAHDAPTMTISMEAADYVELIAGRLNGMTAFMGGRLRISGDMGLAMKMGSLFRSG